MAFFGSSGFTIVRAIFGSGSLDAAAFGASSGADRTGGLTGGFASGSSAAFGITILRAPDGPTGPGGGNGAAGSLPPTAARLLAISSLRLARSSRSAAFLAARSAFHW